jgi:hypothetical protein
MAFGRSSHHQVWSEAMVISPTIRGLFGLEARDGGRTLRFAPQLPANWDRASVENFAAGDAKYNLSINRTDNQTTVRVNRRDSGNARGASRVVIAPAFPLDARISAVTVNGKSAKFVATRAGDVQFVEVSAENPSASTEAVFSYAGGTGVYVETPSLVAGATNQGLRILRARADAAALHLTVEGLGGRSYIANVRTPKRVSETDGVTVSEANGRDVQLTIRFTGAADRYVRRELVLPLTARR